MIDKSTIENLTKEKINKTKIFLVEVKVDTNNNIKVFIDSKTSVSIDDCISISRHIEHSLDIEGENFALEVSSPGIGTPFKVFEQYEKVLGKTIEIILKTGDKNRGILSELNKENFTIKYKVKEKPEGAKRPVWVDKNKTIDFADVKSTIEIITF
jgi:ribosome maturation factor RimP